MLMTPPNRPVALRIGTRQISSRLRWVLLGLVAAILFDLLVAPWLVIPPGVAVVLAVLGFNLLGQGLQDVLDPYHRKGA